VHFKDVSLCGEGRQTKSHLTVTYSAVYPEGMMIEWEGITLTKSCLLEAAAEIAELLIDSMRECGLRLLMLLGRTVRLIEAPLTVTCDRERLFQQSDFMNFDHR